MFEYVFESMSRADDVLDHMKEILDICGTVTVADFYDLVGYSNECKDTKRGWTSLENVRAGEYTRLIDNESVRYRLILPEPEVLEEPEPESAPKPDMVNHPPHYQSSNGMEVIDVIEAFTNTLVGIEATDTGNVLKYMCRWKYKNGLQDLEKAQWYLNHLINHIKEKENK